MEQKHQRATEEAVKREKSCEIFSARSQQVVKSALQGYGFITDEYWMILLLMKFSHLFSPN